MDKYTPRMFVITLGREERVKNIQIQEEKIGEPVEKIQATVGKDLDIQYLMDTNMVVNKIGVGEIGCYMSHLTILNKIKKDAINQYVIIFEDDFKIITDTFKKDVQNILKTIEEEGIDFDFIMLGTINNNKDVKIRNNIYSGNKNDYLWGTHGYLVNYKNIDKILSVIDVPIEMPIDNKYEQLLKNDKLLIYTIIPCMVDQYSYPNLNGNIKNEEKMEISIIR